MPGALSAGTVSLGVKGDAKGFGKKLASDITREAKSSGLSAVGAGIGNIIKVGIGTAVAGIGVMVATGVKEVMENSATISQLNAGIKSTGGAAGVTTKDMLGLAKSVEEYSGQSHGSIEASEKLLLTFVDIKNVGPDKIFNDATRAAADMAAKFGGDAASQSILLGKALNDPVRGITALTRVGVSFSKGQRDTIAAMVKTGDTVGAQRTILAELNKEFGGAAKAAGDSLPGQLKKGENAFKELSGNVVSTFLPLVIPAIVKVSGVLKGLIPVIQDGAKTVRDWLVQAWKDLQPAVSTVWGILKGFGGWVGGTLVPAVAALGSWIRDNSKWLLGLAVVVGSMIVAYKAYVAIMGVVKIATIAWTVVQGILNGTLILNPIGLIVMAIAGLVAGIVWVATQTTIFQDVWKTVWTAVSTWFTGVIDAVIGFVKSHWGLILSFFIGPLGLVIQWIVEHWSGIVSFFETTVGKIGGVFGAIGGIIRGAFQGAVEFVKGALNSVINLVNGILGGINKIPGAVKIATFGALDKFPLIPKLEKGGTVIRPGSVLVGERGPEVLNLPRGASVVPLAKTDAGSGVMELGPKSLGLLRQLVGKETTAVLASSDADLARHVARGQKFTSFSGGY